MRKLLSTTAILAVFTIPTQSQAQESVVFKPYVGFDLQRSVFDYNDNYTNGLGAGLALDGDLVLEDALNGFNIHVGNRFHKNFGVEFGYFRSREESKNIASGATVGPGTTTTADFSTNVKTQGFTLDGLGYLPLDEQGQVELIGTAGVSWTKAELELTVPGVTGSANLSEREFGFRAGGGAQFNITEAVNARGLIRYQSADFEDVADKVWTYSLGLNYSF